MSGIIRGENVNIPKRGQQGTGAGINNINGVFIAYVTENKDSIYTGRIKVQIPEFGSNNSFRWILLIQPFGGVTELKETSKNPQEFGDNESGANGTPKSYGIWPQPPAIGTEVLVAFTSSKEEGYLVGSVISKDRNYMLGGRASAESYDGVLSPVGEKNPFDRNDPDTKPADKEALNVLKEQGLENDYVRGHSMSSARRESPSRVFGITTLGGHTLSIDDGNKDNLSNNIRIKTRQGAQILIDDTNKLLFINNHNASAWIEIDEDGKVDVYANDSISMHTENDFNVHAKGNINMQADKGINMKSTGSEGIKVEATTGDYDLYAENNFKFNAGLNGHVLCGASYFETAQRIDMNGPPASPATKIINNQLVENKNVLQSTASRVPEHHPWNGATKIQETFESAKGNTS